MKKLFIGIIIVVLFFIQIKLCTPDFKTVRLKASNDFSKLSFWGVVRKKEIDKSQHSFPIVIIESLRDTSIIKINFSIEKNHVYDSININDTIMKEQSQLFIWKYNNGIKQKLQSAKF